MTAWMVPNTTPRAKPSILAGMAGTAEAQKPTYSAVPDSAIPAWAASLRQMPSAAPAMASAPSPDPMQVADTAPMPDPAQTTDEGASDAGIVADDPPPPPAPTEVSVSRAAQPPQTQAAPATPHDDYQARRAAWRSQLDSVMQGQTGAGDSG
ncbi:hypothetical protein [Sphingomonas oryzagri]|uniref:Flagellar hook-length control protein FliK n=1 Tax=Sphingomonas oryzagri TaxID=3042314 RepID=A0ABT6N6D8_9SPHN|nr:hypothetical protein [Sphingomonas oryzagri]MDH7640684.1 hypothetical protein [Sphingomonas oryzagri]